jgi:macrolide phosphotransferase
MITTLEQLLAAARAHDLMLQPAGATLDESGVDYLVAHAVDAEGIAWVLRTPRRSDVAAQAEQEYKTLGRLRSRLPIAIPDWRVFTNDVIAYPRLDGLPAAVLDPGRGYVWRFDVEAAPREFIVSLAGTLASLHSIDRSAADPAGFREIWSRRVEIAHRLLMIPSVVGERWANWLRDDSFWPEFAVLVHGDLHPGHILVDGAHRVTGLIDWSEAHAGDPATDFVLLFATLGQASFTSLLLEYGIAGGTLWPAIAGHIGEMWCAYPSTIAAFAETSQNTAHLELAQALVNMQAQAVSPA